jgi:hypothetical protein
MRAMLIGVQARRAGTGAGAALSSGDSAGDAEEIKVDAFRLFAAGGPAGADQAVDLYLQTLDYEVACLGRAIEEHNTEAINQVTHHIRSHASLVGDKALNDAARILRERDASASQEEFQAAYHRIVVRAETLKSTLIASKTAVPIKD